MELHQCADTITLSYSDQSDDHHHLNNTECPVQQIFLETSWTHIYPIDFVHLNDFLNKGASHPGITLKSVESKKCLYATSIHAVRA